MNKLYQDNGMYCRAQNQCDNQWFVGTYIGNEWLLFPRKDNTTVYGCQIKPESICRSTGRENALHVIQDTCESYLYGNDEDCKKCPLCTMTGRAPSCTIRDSDPYVWEIDDNPDTTWRAFKK